VVGVWIPTDGRAEEAGDIENGVKAFFHFRYAFNGVGRSQCAYTCTRGGGCDTVI